MSEAIVTGQRVWMNISIDLLKDIHRASMKGCIRLSFHQNCLVTRRHRGKVAFGSARTSNLSSSSGTEVIEPTRRA